jgi:hypothetical protein
VRKRKKNQESATPPDDLSDRLFLPDVSKYGDRYIEHLLEQYKLYVESADRISDRRQKTNEFFLGLNTALVALLGFIATKLAGVPLKAVFICTSIAGGVLCYCWYRIVRSYKGLNSGKFAVIHAIEKRLPLSLYATEWEVLKRGEDRSVYWPFTHIELFVPWVFVVLYAVVLVAGLFVS